MMGTGKTVAGRVLASRAGSPFYDLDDEVECETGRSVSAIFREGDEEAFRELEAGAVERVAGLPPGVVATGGGAVLRPGNVERMKVTGTVILLQASEEVLAGRLSGEPGRPLLDASDGVRETLAVLAAARHDAYLSAAEIVIDTGGRSPEEVAMAIEEACGDI